MLKIKIFDELKVMTDELRKAYKMEQQMDPKDLRFNKIRKRRERLENILRIKLKTYEDMIETAACSHEAEKNFHSHHPAH